MHLESFIREFLLSSRFRNTLICISLLTGLQIELWLGAHLRAEDHMLVHLQYAHKMHVYAHSQYRLQ